MISKKMMKQIDEEIENLGQQELDKSNLALLKDLLKVKVSVKTLEEMEKKGGEQDMNYREGGYGEYGRRGGYREGGYSEGNYNEGGYNEGGYSEGGYGRRGVKGTGRGRRRYRGDDMLDDMYGAYGEYSEGKDEYERGNYGAENKKMQSLEYMLGAVVEFVKMLEKDAQSQEEVQMIKKYTKKLAE